MPRMSRPDWVALVCVMSAAGACSSAGTPMNTACTPAQCTDAGKPIELAGRFGVLVQLFVDVQAGGGIINQTGLESDLLLLADVTPRTTTADLAVQVCDLVLPPVPVNMMKPIAFELDPALLDRKSVV